MAEFFAGRVLPLKGRREKGRTAGRSAVVLLLGCSFAGGAGAEEPSPVVARVAGVAITAEDFRREMSRRGLGKEATPAQKDALLEEMVRLEVLAARARQLGLDQDPDIVSAVRKMLAGRVLAAELEPTLAAVAVEDAQVKAYYDAHRGEFTTPERRRAAVIRVDVSPRAAPAVRARAHARAEEIAAAARTGEAAFKDAAARYSDDTATRYVGGDLGWVEQDARSPLDPAAREALFALPAPGATSGVVAGGDALYVVRLADRRPAALRPLEDVQGAIRHRLVAERRQALADEYHAKVRSGLAVSVDPAAARAVEGQEARARRDEKPPALPGSRRWSHTPSE